MDAPDDARHLRAAAADVDDHAGADGQPAQRARGHEARLLGAVEHLDGDAPFAARTGQQRLAVAGRAHRRRGHRHGRARPGGAGEGRELGERVERRLHALRAQLAARVEGRGQPQVEALPGDGVEHARHGALDHDHAGRVGAEVDDRERFGRGRRVRGLDANAGVPRSFRNANHSPPVYGNPPPPR